MTKMSSAIRVWLKRTERETNVSGALYVLPQPPLPAASAAVGDLPGPHHEGDSGELSEESERE